MNPKTLQFIAVIGGFLLIFLALAHFMNTYRAGNPKWQYLVMTCGMAIILFNTLFRKKKVKRKP